MSAPAINWQEDGDWAEVLNFAGGGAYRQAGTLKAEDIAQTIASSGGENDGADWVAVVRLKDGRYAFLSAGCDYTGWDCQAGGRAEYAASLEALAQFHIGDDDRLRLGIDVFGVLRSEV